MKKHINKNWLLQLRIWEKYIKERNLINKLIDVIFF